MSEHGNRRLVRATIKLRKLPMIATDYSCVNLSLSTYNDLNSAQTSSRAHTYNHSLKILKKWLISCIILVST